MDADNTHSPGLIRRMVRQVREGSDVVIASRFRRGAQVHGVPWHRALLSIAASWTFRICFPTRGVRDFTCGFRAYRGEVLIEAFRQFGDGFINRDGFEAMVDILLKLRRMKLVFSEVPLILRYDLKANLSKMDVSATIRKTVNLIWRRRLGGSTQ
jgi:dolichol-phosphate mannosyltransferase